MAHPERIRGNRRISLLEEMEEMTVDNAIAKIVLTKEQKKQKWPSTCLVVKVGR